VKKPITTLQVAVVVVGLAFALTGCGESDEEKEAQNPLKDEPRPDPAKPDIPD
jgi:uncharacterized lipoprotein YehR (DUF1307 family)